MCSFDAILKLVHFTLSYTAMLQRIRSLWYILALLLLVSGTAISQVNDKVTWKVLTPTVKGAPGKVVEVKVQAAIASGWHMYTTKRFPDSVAGPLPTEVTAGEKSVLTLGGRLKGPRPIRHVDENFDNLETEYWEGTITLTVPVKISSKAKPGVQEGWVNLYFQTCNDKQCYPGTDKKLTFSLDISDSSMSANTGDTTGIAAGDTAATAIAAPTDTASITPKGTDTVATAHTGAQATPPPAAKASVGAASEIDTLLAAGFWAFLLKAIVAGAIALLTPCVYPMIPITVSFFTKREQNSKARVMRDALLFAVGIIFTFTGLGFIITALTSASGVQDFATNPYVNILMALTFTALALSLFGLFEIQVPTGILNKLNRKASGDGAGAIVIMGLIFSLTSFACTVPFVATIFSNIDRLPWYWPIAGTSAFAAVFALPFFLLAMFPSFLKSMPRSGSWLNAIKVVMGFVEIGFAVKFIAGTDMVWEWNIFTREVCIAIWIAVTTLASFYLLGWFQMPHDTPTEKVGPIRVMFATGFLAAGLWLLTGLFGGNIGELEAHVPPPREGMQATAGLGSRGGNSDRPAQTTSQIATAQSGEGEWMQDNYEAALALAKKSGRPIFIDFTGYFCTNCRWMERNMFPKKDVAELMRKYVLVRLYTDRRDDINLRNRKMQMDRLSTFALPYYAIYTPGDQLVAHSSFTRSTDDFITFLKTGLAQKTATVAANSR